MSGRCKNDDGCYKSPKDAPVVVAAKSSASGCSGGSDDKDEPAAVVDGCNKNKNEIACGGSKANKEEAAASTGKCCVGDKQIGGKVSSKNESSACGDRSCCNVQNNDDCLDTKSADITCFGWIPSQGTDIIVVDARGNLQSFVLKDKNGADGTSTTLRDLCFSSHGHKADDFLTPCFDEEGLHGEPEEPCFCGIDTPHLHAHWHDPKTCTSEHKDTANIAESQLMALAGLTLHPLPASGSSSVFDVNIPNDQYQKAAAAGCNSSDYKSIKPQEDAKVPAEIKVVHGDHHDVLVYNHQTDDLHLEHPCDACGGRDWHGTFALVEKREWQTENESKFQFNVYDQSKGHQQPPSKEQTNTGCCGQETCGNTSKNCNDRACCSKSGDVKSMECCSGGSCGVQNDNTKKNDCCAANKRCDNRSWSERDLFLLSSKFEMEKESEDSGTCCTDESSCTQPCCSTGVCTRRKRPRSDGRVDGDKQKTGRSRFFVDGICCASEIPAIRSIVDPIHGVSNVMINVTTKMVSRAILLLWKTVIAFLYLLHSIPSCFQVYVDHDSKIASAQHICSLLNEQSFGASVEHDHALYAEETSSFVVSIFTISRSDASFVAKLKRFLVSLPEQQVERYELNSTSNELMVIHNPLFVTAMDLADNISSKAGLSATVKVDGDDGKEWEFDKYEHDIAPETFEATWVRPTVALSGVFWIISMLSYVGGNWYVVHDCERIPNFMLVGLTIFILSGNT